MMDLGERAGQFRFLIRDWDTKAIYPAEAIEAHRAFIARRRTTRPSEEHRTPTDEERDSFLAHFETRAVSVGTCARSFGTPCIHEPALDVRSCDRTRRSASDWKRSAATSKRGSLRPSGKDGSAKSKDYKSALPAPTISSPRSTALCGGKHHHDAGHAFLRSGCRVGLNSFGWPRSSGRSNAARTVHPQSPAARPRHRRRTGSVMTSNVHP
jgi:hypothetical protein